MPQFQYLGETVSNIGGNRSAITGSSHILRKYKATAEKVIIEGSKTEDLHNSHKSEDWSSPTELSPEQERELINRRFERGIYQAPLI